MKFGLFLAGAVAAAAFAGQASAQVISDSTGQYSVGIGSNGELYDYASGVGFQRVIDGYDPLQPGTPRDSWSVASNLGAAYADQSDFGSAGLTTGVVAGANSATALSSTLAGFDVADTPYFPEDRLYEKLASSHGDGAHSQYNALIRLLVSFERAAECVSP